MTGSKKLVVAVLVLGLTAGACLLGGSSVTVAKPEVVGAFESDVQGVAATESTVWLSTGASATGGAARIELIELSAVTGEVVSKSDVVGGWPRHGLVYDDGHLVLRATGVPTDVESVELPYFELTSDKEPDSLLRVHIQSREVVDAYDVPRRSPLDPPQPLTVIEGTYYEQSLIAAGSIDLRRGRSDLRIRLGTPGVPTAAHHHADELWLTYQTNVIRVDLASGTATRFNYLDHHDSDNPLPGEFKFHDGKVFVSGATLDDRTNAYEYNLETGEHHDPVPVDDLPDHSLSTGGYRWDLYRAGTWLVHYPIPERGDIWHQVDLSTGETVKQHDLGEYWPVLATDDHLWLLRHLDDGGDELARISIDDR